MSNNKFYYYICIDGGDPIGIDWFTESEKDETPIMLLRRDHPECYTNLLSIYGTDDSIPIDSFIHFTSAEDVKEAIKKYDEGKFPIKESPVITDTKCRNWRFMTIDVNECIKL